MQATFICQPSGHFVHRVPLYYEAKVFFVIFLWHSKTKGAKHLYSSTLQPFLAAHEGTIDQKIGEAKSWFSQSASSYIGK